MGSECCEWLYLKYFLDHMQSTVIYENGIMSNEIIEDTMRPLPSNQLSMLTLEFFPCSIIQSNSYRFQIFANKLLRQIREAKTGEVSV